MCSLKNKKIAPQKIRCYATIIDKQYKKSVTIEIYIFYHKKTIDKYLLIQS